MSHADPAATEELAAAIERLRRLGARLWRQIEQELGLSPVHAHVLEAIDEGASQVSSVAEICGRHVSSASRLVDALVSRGLVTRVEDPADRRAVLLDLTDEGERTIRGIAAAHREFLGRVVARMDDADVDALAASMSRLADTAERVAEEESGVLLP